MKTNAISHPSHSRGLRLVFSIELINYPLFEVCRDNAEKVKSFLDNHFLKSIIESSFERYCTQ